MLLRAGARQRPAAGDRRHRRHGDRLAEPRPSDVESERGGDPRGDRHARRRPGRRRARRVRRRPCSATPRWAARCWAPSRRSTRLDPRPRSTASTGSRYARALVVVTAAGRVDHDAGRRAGHAPPSATGWSGAGEPAPPRRGRTRSRAPGAGRDRRLIARPHRAGPPGARHARRSRRLDERRYAARRAQHRARRRHVLPAVPGDPREARPGLQRRTRRSTDYADAGAFCVYAGCLPEAGARGAGADPRGARRRRRHGITAEELARGRGQLKGGTVLGLEDTGSRMSRIGKSELVLRRVPARAGGPRPAGRGRRGQVREVATELFGRPMCLAVVGPYRESDLDRL